MHTKHVLNSPILVTILLMITTFIGMGMAMAFTEDPRWLEWHMSRLGEGRHVSSYIFNVCAILVGILLMAYGRSIARHISGKEKRDEAGMFRGLSVIAGCCLIGVAVFPFDEFPVLHNVFGYCFFFLAGFMMIGIYSLFPYLSARTRTIGWVAGAVIVSLMSLHHLTRFTTLLVVEMLGGLFLFAWLLSAAIDIEPVANRSRLDEDKKHAKL